MTAQSDFDFGEFRQEYLPNDNCILEKCSVDIQLLDDLESARYTYNCNFRTVGDRPEIEYTDVIPSSSRDVKAEYAKDSDGGLEFSTTSDVAKKTRLNIKFRYPIKKGEEYGVQYSYITKVIRTKTDLVFGKSINYTDWFVFDIQCDHLEINISLPSHSKPKDSTPVADLSHNPIVFEIENLRPLEAYFFSLAYLQSGIGRKFWLWLGSAAGSGGLGALISQLLG